MISLRLSSFLLATQVELLTNLTRLKASERTTTTKKQMKGRKLTTTHCELEQILNSRKTNLSHDVL